MSKWHFIAIALAGVTGTDQLPKKWNDWYSRKGHRPTRWSPMSEFDPNREILRFCFKFWLAARADRRLVKVSPSDHPAFELLPHPTPPFPAATAGQSGQSQQLECLRMARESRESAQLEHSRRLTAL